MRATTVHIMVRCVFFYFKLNNGSHWIVNKLQKSPHNALQKPFDVLCMLISLALAKRFQVLDVCPF